MNKVIFPEIVPDVAILKDALTRELPPGCKIKMAPFNRKGLRVVKSFFVATDVLVRRDRIVLTNPVLMLMGVYVLICLPLAIYAMLKLKESEALRSSVQDILFRATRNNTVASGEA
jgi:hypothetical protein